MEKDGQILSDLLDKIALIIADKCIFFLFVHNLIDFLFICVQNLKNIFS